MRILSWNVNGLRAVYKKGFVEAVARMDPDILCLQETKLQEDQRSQEMINFDTYQSFWRSMRGNGRWRIAVVSELNDSIPKGG